MHYSTFETELTVRPDDIDMNAHVHNTKYLDYVLAARYDQMHRCYGMSMEKFIERGLGWVVNTCFIEFKRPLFLGETIRVRTHIIDVGDTHAKVGFEILKKSNGKLSADGYIDYTLISIATGRAEKLPQDVIEQYSI
ncbi:MAG TPA: acyl-CoA thioesterase [Bacteroidota bacterium]|nr:acyl-CoA thioesterase [Bacteroidota bacterium]